jgi:hypothetical protein
MPNELSQSTSLYLRQHAGNPVDWLPWGPEALARAEREDKPILLSIGYSACHWCHVMAHESFESPTVAALMNAHFVNIKVDREERPDVDAVYVEAVQAMTGHAGWPLTVFLTPQGEPFYGGTYFPPEPRHGLAGFSQILEAIAAAWRERRPEVQRSAGELAAALRRATVAPAAPDEPTAEVVVRAAGQLLAGRDARYGGFGRAPKFPQPSNLSFLLARHVRSGDPELLAAVTQTLQAMAAGGIYDQLGGGFHRYSVDERWAVPHFEKMLYDNAQLADLYVAAWRVSGEADFRRVAEETLDYLRREMTDPAGGFYATQDADTAAGEGASFTWTPAEVEEALPPPQAAAAAAWYGLADGGQTEDGRTVLSTQRSLAEVAEQLGRPPADVAADLRAARLKLLAVRDRRERPETDRRVIVAWNALTIEAFARAGIALERADYVDAALAAARFIEERVRLPDGLAHSWQGDQPGVAAFQEDYAALAAAYLTLYEATFEAGWLQRAQTLIDEMIAHFGDPDGAGFFRTGPRHERLIARQKELTDSALASGNAVAATALLRLAALLAEPAYETWAEGVFRLTLPLMARYPSACGAMLAGLDTSLHGLRAVAVVGPLGDGAADLLAEARRGWRPGMVVAYSPQPLRRPAAVPVLAARPLVGGRAAAYVCRGRVCDAPVVEPAALAGALAAGDGANAPA